MPEVLYDPTTIHDTLADVPDFEWSRPGAVAQPLHYVELLNKLHENGETKRAVFGPKHAAEVAEAFVRDLKRNARAANVTVKVQMSAPAKDGRIAVNFTAVDKITRTRKPKDETPAITS